MGIPRDPVFVHQMGKVGSTAIYRAIKDAGHDDRVFQTHVLTDFDRVARQHSAEYPYPEETLAQLELAKVARAYLDRANTASVINVVTAVRDPIARDVSAFFQTAIERDPDFEEKAALGAVSMEELRHVFFARSHHATLTDWFDAQFAPVFGVDLASVDFDPRAASAVYIRDNVRILVLKFEHYRTELQPALRSFLGNRRIRIDRRNDSSTKPYGRLFAQFMAEPFPAAYVDSMLAGPVVRTFYSPIELHLMRSRYVAA